MRRSGISNWQIGAVMACVLCAVPVAGAQHSTAPAERDLPALADPEADKVVINDPFDPNRDEAVEISDERLDAALAAITGDEALQKDRPEAAPEPIRLREPREPNPILDAIARFFAALFGFFGSTLGVLTLLAVAGLVLFLLYLMFGEGITLRGREQERKAEKAISIAPDLKPDEAAARALLGDADALAAAGRYAEAVHALLFRSIDLIQERRPSALKRSLTAREIGDLGDLPETIKTGLSPIIRIVERSYFGGQAVDEAGWREARAAYNSFAFGEAKA